VTEELKRLKGQDQGNKMKDSRKYSNKLSFVVKGIELDSNTLGANSASAHNNTCCVIIQKDSEFSDENKCLEKPRTKSFRDPSK
jgi:hypothetical protein